MEKGQKSLASRGLWQLPLGKVIRPAATVKSHAPRDPSGEEMNTGLDSIFPEPIVQPGHGKTSDKRS